MSGEISHSFFRKMLRSAIFLRILSLKNTWPPAVIFMDSTAPCRDHFVPGLMQATPLYLVDTHSLDQERFVIFIYLCTHGSQ